MAQTIHSIGDHIHVITENLGSNNGAIVTREGVVLFDTPHKPTDALRWKEYVEALGPTKYLVISDHHIDHTLSNAFFGGTLISSDGARKTLLERHPTVPFMEGLLARLDPEGVPLIHGDYRYRIPDITVSGRAALYLGDTEIQLIPKKGHTPNNLMAYLPREKVLFSGDNVCECGLPSSQECCLPELFDTLDFILNELDVETIVPGHGEVCGREGAVRFRERYGEYRDRILRGMRDGKSKKTLMDEVRFPDRIHCGTKSYDGYPELMIEEFQRNSVSRIYHQLEEKYFPRDREDKGAE